MHHVPFPLTDLAIATFGLSKRTALVVYWHAEIVGRSSLKRLLAPMFRRALARADAIIVSDAIMAENSPLLRRVAAKCVTIPYGIDTNYWRSLDDIKAYAGADIEKTHNLPRDPEFLIELEPNVRHFTVKMSWKREPTGDPGRTP